MFRISARNIHSFQELEFDFANKGLVCIEGQNKDEALCKSNGSGKTNMVDTLCWGLYGKSLKGKHPDKVVNLQVGKDCKVEVWWGDYHTIRYRKDTKNKNDVQFFYKDQPVTQKSNATTQDLIDEAIGLSYESFVNSIYFQQNTVSNFATATDSEQKAIIENLLNLGILTVAQEVCKEKVKEYLTQFNEITVKFNQASMRRNDAEQRIKQLEGKAIDFDQQKMTECGKWQQHVQTIKDKKAVMEAREPFDVAAIKNMIDALIPYRAEIKSLENRLLEINSDRRGIQTSEQDFWVGHKVAKDRMELARADLAKWKNRDPNKCPTCEQPVNVKVIETHISNAEQAATLAEGQFTAIDEQRFGLRSTGDLDKETAAVQKQINEKRELLDIGEQLKKKLLEAEYHQKELTSLEDRIKEAQQQLQAAMLRTNPYTEQVIEETGNLNKYGSECNELMIQLEGNKYERSFYEYWVDGLANSRLKSYIMDSITPILNERANYYSQFLTGGAFHIDISTVTKLKSGELRDKFSVNIVSPSGADYELSSGGEKKRLDICILLALQDIVASRAKQPLQLLIMDEVSENLDEIGVERMLELLHNITSSKGSCFYITHDEAMKPLFPNVVTIVKQHGVSTIAV